VYDVCHTLTLPVNLNSANEILVSLKLTAAAAPTTGNVLWCEAEDVPNSKLSNYDAMLIFLHETVG
jgi:hypothetical protein